MSDNLNFSKDKAEEPEVTNEAPQTVKVGEKEYSQEDLERVVGLGELGVEMEEKWKTKIDSVYPEFTKKSQQLKEREAEVEELKKFKEEQEARATQSKVESGEQLSQEEIQEQAIAEAKKLGLVTKDDFRTFYQEQRAAEKLVEQADSLVASIKKDGKPEATTEEILTHMRDTGIRKVDAAYKDMREAELDKWKEDQLSKVKKTGMVTEESSTAGAPRVPGEKIPQSKEDLEKALKSHFS